MTTIPIATVDCLRLPRSIRDEAMIHLISAAPHEGVGLLAVSQPVQDEDELVARGTRFYPGTNTDRSRTRFTMDPVEVLAALKDMRANGWHLGAIVHSHLTGPATPSATDVREAHYPDALMLIVSLADQPASTGVWRVVQDDDLSIVQNVRLDIEDGA